MLRSGKFVVQEDFSVFVSTCGNKSFDVYSSLTLAEFKDALYRARWIPDCIRLSNYCFLDKDDQKIDETKTFKEIKVGHKDTLNISGRMDITYARGIVRQEVVENAENAENADSAEKTT